MHRHPEENNAVSASPAIEEVFGLELLRGLRVGDKNVLLRVNSRSRGEMNYFLDLFSPETYNAFSLSKQSVSGFRKRHTTAAGRVKPGDKLVCYMTKLSRWIGLLEVIDGPFQDDKPIFYPDNDPFVIRFRVRPIVWLPPDRAVPIYDAEVWNHLSFTCGQARGTPTWTGSVRTSLVQMNEDDGRLIESLLVKQNQGGKVYPID